MARAEHPPRFEVVIDLTQGRVDAVGAMRAHDGPLLHDALVVLLLKKPPAITVVMTQCPDYDPSLFAVLLRCSRLARAMGSGFVVEGTDQLLDDVSRRHLEQLIPVQVSPPRAGLSPASGDVSPEPQDHSEH